MWFASRLIARSSVARREICIRGGRVVLRNGAGFAERVVAARIALLEEAEYEAQADGRRGRGRSRAVQRMLSLWTPQARRLILARVESEDAAAEEFGAAWGLQS